MKRHVVGSDVYTVTSSHYSGKYVCIQSVHDVMFYKPQLNLKVCVCGTLLRELSMAFVVLYCINRVYISVRSQTNQ